MSKVRVELRIEGRVQGVWYRQSTKQMADRVGVTGWVRNCPDGSVAASFEGEKVDVDAAIGWCRQGPPAAHVTGVELTWLEEEAGFTDFKVRS